MNTLFQGVLREENDYYIRTLEWNIRVFQIVDSGKIRASSKNGHHYYVFYATLRGFSRKSSCYNVNDFNSKVNKWPN